MSYGLRILPAADADVDEAAIFIANNSLEVALRFYDAVDQTYRQIAGYPEQFQVYPMDHPRLAGMRKCSVQGFPNHIIFYRIDADMVEIVRVLHGARDIPSALSDDGAEDTA